MPTLGGASGDSVASVQSNSVTPHALSVQPVPALGAWALAWLAALLGRLAHSLPRRNEDMVLTEAPLR